MFTPSIELLPRVLAGAPGAIGRMISRAESGSEEARPALAALYRKAGKAHVIGLTGVPGAGKSALVAALIRAFAAHGRKVGVVAVDPSSPYSGGAILGDRLRMSDSAEQGGAFVRSMATRGQLGGLAAAALEAVDVLDAAGYSPIIIETVGVGQDEVEITSAAHTVVVLSAPGLGDEIQAIKAGVMEIADLHAVSKADKPEAAAAVAAIRAMLVLGSDTRTSRWAAPVLPVSALSGEGVDELVQTIQAHRQHLHDSGELPQRRALIARKRILGTIDRLIRRRFDAGAAGFASQVQAVSERSSDPQAAATRLLDSSAGSQP